MTWKQAAVLLCALFVVMLSIMAMEKRNDYQIITEKVIGVSAICRDGMYSTSQHDNGTCSGHGGVKQWITK